MLDLVGVLEARSRFVEDISPTKAGQQSVTKIISLTIMNLVAPKAGAKRELLYNKPASDKGFVEHLSAT